MKLSFSTNGWKLSFPEFIKLAKINGLKAVELHSPNASFGNVNPFSKANINDTYCLFEKGELYLRNAYIAEYEYGTHYNHTPRSDRKLLLKRRELNRLEKKIKEKGFTIVPITLYINEKGLAKMSIGLARGKKLFDKREDIKLKDTKREMDRMNKIK